MVISCNVMGKKYYCTSCEVRFKTATQKRLHREFAHNDNPVFLDAPEPVEATSNVSYLEILEAKAKRFPAYERYLGRGKDYYNTGGMMEALGISKRKKP